MKQIFLILIRKPGSLYQRWPTDDGIRPSLPCPMAGCWSQLVIKQVRPISYPSPKCMTPQPYNATFFSPLFLGAYDGQDTPGDCAVGARPQRRGSPQSYTPGRTPQLGIPGQPAPPSALVLFPPNAPASAREK